MLKQSKEPTLLHISLTILTGERDCCLSPESLTAEWLRILWHSWLFWNLVLLYQPRCGWTQLIWPFSYEKHIQQCWHNVLTLNCPVFEGLIMVMRTKVTGVMANVVVMAVWSVVRCLPLGQHCTLENGQTTRDQDMAYWMTSSGNTTLQWSPTYYGQLVGDTITLFWSK